MKNILLLAVLIFITNQLCAQQIELDELSTPSTPAFSILDLSPTSISRPTLGKTFLMSLANGLNNNNIVSDVAIETTPYWWVSRPGLTYEKYYGLDTDSASDNIFDQISSTLSLSFATSDASPEIDSIDSRYLAGGLRFQVLKGQPSQSFKNAYHNLLQNDQLLIRASIAELKQKVDLNMITTLQALKTDIEVSVQSIISTNSDYQNLTAQDVADYKQKAITYIRNMIDKMDATEYDKTTISAYLEKERASVSENINTILMDMQGMSRVGWLLEFAGAASLYAPTNKIDYTMGHNWAGWGTLTYRFEPTNGNERMTDLNFMLRIGGNFQNASSYNTDFGLSWVSSGDNYSLSLEGLLRSYRSYMDITAIDGQTYEVSDTDNTWRFALAYQYKLSDNINITVTAGKDFENSTISADGMFSLLNLNLTLPGSQKMLVNNN
jgi:hypothetical protein